MVSKLVKGIVLGLVFVGGVSTVNASSFEVVDSELDLNNKKIGDVFTIDLNNPEIVNKVCKHLSPTGSLVLAERKIAEQINKVVSENNLRWGLRLDRTKKVNILGNIHEYGVSVSAISIISSPGIISDSFSNDKLPNDCGMFSFDSSDLEHLSRLGFKFAGFETVHVKCSDSGAENFGLVMNEISRNSAVVDLNKKKDGDVFTIDLNNLRDVRKMCKHLSSTGSCVVVRREIAKTIKDLFENTLTTNLELSDNGMKINIGNEEGVPISELDIVGFNWAHFGNSENELAEGSMFYFWSPSLDRFYDYKLVKSAELKVVDVKFLYTDETVNEKTVFEMTKLNLDQDMLASQDSFDGYDD
jgi:hypothetical protein